MPRPSPSVWECDSQMSDQLRVKSLISPPVSSIRAEHNKLPPQPPHPAHHRYTLMFPLQTPSLFVLQTTRYLAPFERSPLNHISPARLQCDSVVAGGGQNRNFSGHWNNGTRYSRSIRDHCSAVRSTAKAHKLLRSLHAHKHTHTHCTVAPCLVFVTAETYR